jgi:hypothetical protein
LILPAGLQAAALAGSDISTDQAGQILQVVATSLGIKQQAVSPGAARRSQTGHGRLLSSIFEAAYDYLLESGGGPGSFEAHTAGRHLLQLSNDPALAILAQQRLKIATSLLHQTITSLSASAAPTEVVAVHSSGLSTSTRAELRTAMAGSRLEAGPDANGGQQPNSMANAMAMLPDALEVPAAPCADDGASCVDPPALLRLDAYSSFALFMDVLTNGLLASSGEVNYTSVAPLSSVANVSIPTHLAAGAQLACRGDAGSCQLTLRLPLAVAPAAHRSGAACVELVQVGGLVASVQVAYAADVAPSAGAAAAYATCRVPKLGTFMAVQYIVAAPRALVTAAPALEPSFEKESGAPPATPAETELKGLGSGRIAAAVIGSMAGVALVLGVVVVAGRRGLIPPIKLSLPASCRRAAYLASRPAGRDQSSGRSGGSGGSQRNGGLAPPPTAALAV